LQVSSVQTLSSLQTGAGPPVQTPAALHVSFVVQALPSSQLLSGTGVYTHPDAVQVSSVHGLLSLHTTSVPPQTPAVQTSFDVHTLPSSQELPDAGS
jgi:hypothetical protein